MKENKNMKCDPCERDFEHKINELVKEGKSLSHEEHQKKKQEVKTAFEAHHSANHEQMKHPTTTAVPKPAEKHPVMAGAAKMKK